MKRVPPSAKMKEEFEAMLRGEVREGEPRLENPMKGFVRGMAQYMLQVSVPARFGIVGFLLAVAQCGDELMREGEVSAMANRV